VLSSRADMSGLAEKVPFLLVGIRKRLGQACTCPSCGARLSALVDRKYVYELRRCASCMLLYMYPRETAAELHRFYQGAYRQPGLITDLPDETTLEHLRAHGFAGSSKDFAGTVRLLGSLGLGPGSRVLDFGASWGYATHQLGRAGFAAEGFEISEDRAAFGRQKLGVAIHTSLASLTGPYDCVYSSHAVEHTPDPRGCLAQQLALVRPGGFVAAHLPNGSRAFMERDYAHFHQLWGRVHPVMIDGLFLRRSFPDLPLYLSTEFLPESLATWDRRTFTEDGPLTGDELFFVLRR
jgi:2-polyprenyl-3-methyl-5-hydroxy-6-metoxy-1,4-benzoquinol methylase